MHVLAQQLGLAPACQLDVFKLSAQCEPNSAPFKQIRLCFVGDYMTGFYAEGHDSSVHRDDTGRWLSSDIPHSGWRLQTFVDRGDDTKKCEMCQNALVRFAHVLVHSEVPSTLAVGLKCAEILEGDFFHPEKREREYRTDLRLAREWPSREWKHSNIGNLYTNARGFNIAIWDKGGSGFGVTVKQQDRFGGNYVRSDPRMYRSIEGAKLGALERLLEARAWLRTQE